MPERAILINNTGAECYFNNALQGAFASTKLCDYTLKFDFTKNSIGESYKNTLQQYIQIANSHTEKPAFLDTPINLTKQLFHEDSKLDPSSTEGTGKQGNPKSALAAIMHYAQKSFIEKKENGYNVHPCATIYVEKSYCTKNLDPKCAQQPIVLTKTDYIIKSININHLDKTTLQDIFGKYNYKSVPLQCPACGKKTFFRETSLASLPATLIVDTEDPNSQYPFSTDLTINTSTLTPNKPQLIVYQLIAMTMRTQKKPTLEDKNNPWYSPPLGGHYYALVRFRNTWYLTDEPESTWWYKQPNDTKTITKPELLLSQALNQLKNYEATLFPTTKEADVNYQKIMAPYMKTSEIPEKAITIDIHSNQTPHIIAQQGYLERFIKDIIGPIGLFADVPSLLFYEEVLRQDLTPPQSPTTQLATTNPLPQLNQELLLLCL